MSTCLQEHRHQVPGPQEEKQGTGALEFLPRALLSPCRTGSQVHRKTTLWSWLWGYAVMEATS